MSLTESAAPAAVMARGSGLTSPSYESSQEMTWVSRCQFFRNIGLIGLSTSLLTNTSASLGLPSLLR